MEQNNRYQEEIELKDLMYAVFRRWRSVIVVGIIVAILLGAYKGISMIKAINNPNVLSEIEDENKLYIKTQERYEKEINNIKNDIENKENYLKDSLLMQVDPYNMYVAKLNYYIIAEEQDFRIINYYLSYAQGGDLYSRISEKLKKSIDFRYLSEVLVFTANNDSNMLTVSLVSADSETNSLIIDCVKEGLEERSREIKEKVGEHTFKIINETQYQTIDLNLANTINNIEIEINTLRTNLDNKQIEYEALKEPRIVNNSYIEAIKSLMKFFIVGIVLGVVLATAYHIFMFLFSDKLHDRKKLSNRYQLKLIGDLSKPKYGKLFKKLDRWLAKIFGQVVANASQDDIYQIMAANIVVLSSVDHTRDYLITGSVSEETLESIQKKLINMNKLKEMKFNCSGNIATTALTIEKASHCDGIILVEKLYESRISEIEREIEMVKNIGKVILGVILIS